MWTDTFSLSEYELFLYLYCHTLFETQERQRFNYTTFVNMQTRCVFFFFFLLSGYGNRFFFFFFLMIAVRTRTWKEGLNRWCVPFVSWDLYVEKTSSTPDCIFREEIAIYVVPSDNVSQRLPVDCLYLPKL